MVAGIFLRLVRVNLLQTLRSDYVEAARARGIHEGRVVRDVVMVSGELRFMSGDGKDGHAPIIRQ